MRSSSTISTYLSFALFTAAALAAPAWEPVHKYDYHLPPPEFRSTALHLSDELQQHLPAQLNNRLPYLPEDIARALQFAQAELLAHPSSSKSSTNVFPTLNLTLLTPSLPTSFLSLFFLVAAILAVTIFAFRFVRALRRRRFFAARAKEAEYSIYKEKDDDYILSPLKMMSPLREKLRLSPPAPSSPVEDEEVGVGSGNGNGSVLRREWVVPDTPSPVR